MNRTWHLRIRKTHRYLGLFIGIQFLLWTVGGLYFSWSNLDEIHGNHLKRPAAGFSVSQPLVSPSVPLQALEQTGFDSVLSINLIKVLSKPVYQLSYRMHHKDGHTMTQTQLANARTGQLRGELTQAEATALAQQRFAGPCNGLCGGSTGYGAKRANRSLAHFRRTLDAPHDGLRRPRRF